MLEKTTELINKLDDLQEKHNEEDIVSGLDYYYELRELENKMEKSMKKFIENSPTCQIFKGLRLPNYRIDMPELEESEEIYQNCSRWFMQSSPYQAIEAILRLKNAFPEGKTFLDVGSGTGFVVSLAKELGLEAKGIEGSKVLINLIPEMAELEIYNQDFFYFDQYGEFDLIHLWNPSPQRMVELSSLIVNQAANKVAILGAYKRNLTSEWNSFKNVMFRGLAPR